MGGTINRRDFLGTFGLSAASLAIPQELFAAKSLDCNSNQSCTGKSKDERQSRAIMFNRTIPVRYQTDVFVAGGGPSGIAASLAAARQGRKVYLAEGHSCFGGMATAGLVPCFAQFTDGVNFLTGGIGQEIYNRSKKDGAIFSNNPDGWTTIKTEALKRVYDDMIGQAGVEFTFHTNLIGVETSGRNIIYAICAAKSGLFAVKAKMFIDATGNGDLAAWAGAPYEKGDESGNLMPGTLCSLWADINWEANKGQSAPKAVIKAINDGIFTIPDRHLSGILQVGTHVGGGNIGHTFGVDGTDEISLTKALLWGRKVLNEYERFYKEYLKGYEKMTLVATGSLLGVRETRRIKGDYVLSLNDFKTQAVFGDEIGRYSYPVDVHPSKPDEKSFEKFTKEYSTLRYDKGQSYGIPYRILTPLGLDNVLVAGRCVSCDRYMQGSIRVMPGCFITGQAAGIAAAIAVEESVSSRGVDVKRLQQRLKKMGAFLPNA